MECARTAQAQSSTNRYAKLSDISRPMAMNEPIASPIPVTLLTGFLGSGKTTVLNHLVRQPELADALVIINEFGEIALDHLMVAHSTENLTMEMSSGCLCCTIRGDLVKTLRDITWRFSRNGQRHFQRVLIETTGLADPAPIIHTLMTHPQIAKLYQLDGIIATVDAVAGTRTLDKHPEAVKQAAMADALLLTKSDLATDEQRTVLQERLRIINPAAPHWMARNGEIAPGKVLRLGLFSTEGKAPDVMRWLNEEAYAEQSLDDHGHDHDHQHHHALATGDATSEPTDHDHGNHDINRHDDHIRSFCFAVDDPMPIEIVIAWIEVLMGLVGDNILRFKGILHIQGKDRPVVMHGVQHVLHPPMRLPEWPSDDRRSRMVFITYDIDRDVIQSSYDAFCRVLSQAGETAQ